VSDAGAAVSVNAWPVAARRHDARPRPAAPAGRPSAYRNHVHDESVARAILAAREGRGPATAGATLTPIGDGFASDAWLVTAADGNRAVLRIANDRNLVAVTYPMEHALMARLVAVGAAVPHPLVGSWEVADWTGPAFSLTSWASGGPMRPSSVRQAAPQLAAFLAALRTILVPDGFGLLEIAPDGALRGSCRDLSKGLVTWAGRPLWPLDGSRLADHPAIGPVPGLARRIGAWRKEVTEALLDGPTVVLHSDLHEQNVLDDEGRLTFIDFGEALIGPLAWDLAAIAFFLDWSVADTLIGDDQGLAISTARIGLCFGAYRWHSSREHQFDDDEHDRVYLETCLDRLGG
jgi:Ser/Thr protein kinase RdoA (MazF antagonist)